MKFYYSHTCSSGALLIDKVEQAVESANAEQQIGVPFFCFIVHDNVNWVWDRRLLFDNGTRRLLIGRVCIVEVSRTVAACIVLDHRRGIRVAIDRFFWVPWGGRR